MPMWWNYYIIINKLFFLLKKKQKKTVCLFAYYVLLMLSALQVFKVTFWISVNEFPQRDNNAFVNWVFMSTVKYEMPTKTSWYKLSSLFTSLGHLVLKVHYSAHLYNRSCFMKEICLSLFLLDKKQLQCLICFPLEMKSWISLWTSLRNPAVFPKYYLCWIFI